MCQFCGIEEPPSILRPEPQEEIEIEDYPRNFLPRFLDCYQQWPRGKLIGPMCTKSGTRIATAVLVPGSDHSHVVPIHVCTPTGQLLWIPTMHLRWVPNRRLLAIKTSWAINGIEDAKAALAAWMAVSVGK